MVERKFEESSDGNGEGDGDGDGNVKVGAGNKKFEEHVDNITRTKQ
jgi:hypothetical protein